VTVVLGVVVVGGGRVVVVVVLVGSTSVEIPIQQTIHGFTIIQI